MMPGAWTGRRSANVERTNTSMNSSGDRSGSNWYVTLPATTPLGSLPSSMPLRRPRRTQGLCGRPDPGENIDVGQGRWWDGRPTSAGTADYAYQDWAIVGGTGEAQRPLQGLGEGSRR